MTKRECMARIQKLMRNKDADVEFPAQIHQGIWNLQDGKGTLGDIYDILKSIKESR